MKKRKAAIRRAICFLKHLLFRIADERCCGFGYNGLAGLANANVRLKVMTNYGSFMGRLAVARQRMILQNELPLLRPRKLHDLIPLQSAHQSYFYAPGIDVYVIHSFRGLDVWEKQT